MAFETFENGYVRKNCFFKRIPALSFIKSKYCFKSNLRRKRQSEANMDD